MQVVHVLMKYKRIEHPYVGMRIANYTPKDPKQARNGNGNVDTSERHGFWKRKIETESELQLPDDFTNDTHTNTNTNTNTNSSHVVVITDVEPGSPAALANLQRGDVILEVNNILIVNVRQVLKAIGYEMNKTLKLKIQRKGEIIVTKLTTAPKL